VPVGSPASEEASRMVQLEPPSTITAINEIRVHIFAVRIEV